MPQIPCPFHALVEAMVDCLPKEKRTDAVRSCRRAIAVALQIGVANQIHAAGTPPALAAEVSYIASTPQGGDQGTPHELSDFEDTQEEAGSPAGHAANPDEIAAAAGA